MTKSNPRAFQDLAYHVRRRTVTLTGDEPEGVLQHFQESLFRRQKLAKIPLHLESLAQKKREV